MAKKGGKVCWVPKVVVEELDDIMRQEGVNVPAEAMHRMAKYSKTARKSDGFRPPVMDELEGLGKRRKKSKFVGGLFG